LKIKACFNQVTYCAVFVLLLPLLLLQAIWVRLTIIKLPEATGERTSSTDSNAGSKTDSNTEKHANQAIKLLILGDSAAAGVGVNQQKQALAGQLPPLLTTQQPINWQLVASSGLTSSQVINQVTLLPAQKFDLVLVSVGVNDVTHLTRQAQWAENINSLAMILSNKFNADKILFSSVPPMHLFTALPQPLRWWLGLRATKLNTIMAAELAKLPPQASQKCSILTVDIPFSPEFLATDGMHPSMLAYKVWAEQAAKQFNLFVKASQYKKNSKAN
jgi:lysophospholipase L1-like esterase